MTLSKGQKNFQKAASRLVCGAICAKVADGGCTAFSFDAESGVCRVGTYSGTTSTATGLEELIFHITIIDYTQYVL